MSRLANLPIAARLGAGFGLLALAMLAITLTAVQAFGTFRDDTQKLSDRDVRALAVAGELGQDVQGAGREAVEHLYVYDGDLASQDKIQADAEAMLKQTKAESAELTKLLAGTPAAAQAAKIAKASDAWSAKVTEAVKRSRQETVDNVEERDGSRKLYVEEISGETGTLAADVVALQAAVNKGTDATADAVAARAGSTSKMLLIVMAIALLFATAIAVLITRSVVGPVKGLMNRLRSLDEQDLTSLTSGLEAAAAGDFTREATLTTEPLNVRATDEIGQLAATFDAMLGKADRSIAAYGAMREQLGTLIGEVVQERRVRQRRFPAGRVVLRGGRPRRGRDRPRRQRRRAGRRAPGAHGRVHPPRRAGGFRRCRRVVGERDRDRPRRRRGARRGP